MVKSQPSLRYIRITVVTFLLTTALTACTHHVSPSSAEAPYSSAALNHPLQQTSQDEFEELVRSVDVKSRLLKQYSHWKGIRYRLGGASKKGVDCSAFVQLTFRDQFGLKLPRSTGEQKKSGKPIARNKLRPGDLVLFRSGSTGRHIGIYLGNDNFVHASSSNGVMISSLNDHYWKNRYREARRVLTSTQS